MPGWEEHCIEFVLDDLRDVVQNSSLLEGECDAVHGLLLHVSIHVCKFDDGVLSFLLVEATMTLHSLFVFGWLPFLGLLDSCVCDGSCSSHYFQLIIN